MRQGQGWRGIAIAAVAAASLVPMGCGDGAGESTEAGETTGSVDLARLAPTDAVVYGEVLLRPEDGEQEEIEQFAKAVSGRPAEFDGLLEDVFAELQSENEMAGRLSFADDVEPWLGDRVAFWASGLGRDGDAASGAIAVAISDPAAARAAMKKAMPYAGYMPTATGGSHHPNVYATLQSAYSVIDDALVIGTRGAVTDAAFANGEDGLGESKRFRKAVADSGAQESALCMYTLFGRLFLADATGGGGGYQFSADQARSWLEESGFDVDAPAVTTLDVTPTSAVFDVQLGVDEAPDLAGTEELLESLPEDAWFAFANDVETQIYLEALQMGTEIGLRQAANQEGISLETAREVLVRRFGTDVISAFKNLKGSAAISIEGNAPLSLLGTVVAPVRPYGRKDDPLVAAVAMAESIVRGVRFTPAKPFPHDALASVLMGLPTDAPIGARLSETEDQLIFQVAGPVAGIPSGLTPERTAEDSERLTDAREALPKGFRVMGFVDVDEMLDVFPSLDEGDERFGNALENVELRIGARVKDGRYTQRFQLDVERAGAREHDALEQGNGDEDEDGEAPGLDDEVS